MVLVHTLVTEYLADLIYAVKSADDQSLEVELKRDPQSHVDVECVVMCPERPCSSAACDVAEYRCLDLHQVVILLEDFTHGADDLGSLAECISYILIHDEVYVSLTVSEVHILETVPLVRQYLQGLAEELYLHCPYADLACLGLEYDTGNTEDIAYIVCLEYVVLILSDVVSCYEDLDAALLVLHVDEGYLAHAAESHDTSCDSDLLILHRIKSLLDVSRVSSHVKSLFAERVSSHLTELFQFLSLDLSLFAYFLFSQFSFFCLRVRVRIVF